MAFYKQDIVDVNLETGVIHRSFLNHTIGHKDAYADRFGIRAFRNGEPVDLSGAQCQAVFMAPDGTNIALTSYGTVSGNEAYVTLPQACYNVEGQFCLAIKLVGGGVTATVRIIDGVVDRTGATGAVAPTEAVPTYQEILAVYAQMQEDIADYESVVANQNDQINSLKSALFLSDKLSAGLIDTIWEQGGLVTATGVEYSSTKNIRTPYINVTENEAINIRGLDTANFHLYIHEFTAVGTQSGSAREITSTSFTPTKSILRFRMTRYDNSQDLAPSGVPLVFYKKQGYLYDTMPASNNYMIYRGTPADNTDLDTVIGTGFYYLPSSNTYTHAPQGYDFGLLMIAGLTGGSAVAQTLFVNGRDVWTRSIGNGTWSEWDVLNERACILDAGANVNTLYNRGTYQFHGTNVSGMTGLPEDYDANVPGFVYVITKSPANYICEQILFNQYNRMWIRYHNSSYDPSDSTVGWTAWKKITKSSRTLASNTDINTLYESGEYSFYGNDTTPITGKPSDFGVGPGVLQVISGASGYARVEQVIYDWTGRSWNRYHSDEYDAEDSSVGWTEWKKRGNFIAYHTSLTSSDNIDTLADPGTYYIFGTDVGSVGGTFPERWRKTACNITCLKAIPNANRSNVQILTGANNTGIFMRYNNGSEWEAWKKIDDECWNLTAGEDINTLYNSGEYSFTRTVSQTLNGLPVGFDAPGVLNVMTGGFNTVGRVMQMLFDGVRLLTYIRYHNDEYDAEDSSVGWTEWKSFDQTGFDANRYRKHRTNGSLQPIGLPALYITGNMTGISKDTAVDISFKYVTNAASGTGYSTSDEYTGTLKWQGRGSLSFPKKNFTLNKIKKTVDGVTTNGYDFGWGLQTKYCLKGNYLDPSMANNLTGAKLWGDLAADHSETYPAQLVSSPNYGTVDGFPIMLFINEEYQGVYDLNVPKDKWMADMTLAEGTAECIVCSDASTDTCAWAALAETLEDLQTGWCLEELSKGIVEREGEDKYTGVALHALNQAIGAVMTAYTNQDHNWEQTVGQYIDIDSAIDFYILRCLIDDRDAMRNNQLMFTYNLADPRDNPETPTKWYFIPYDMDMTFGASNLYYSTERLLKIGVNRFSVYATQNRLFYLIYNYSKDRLKARYTALRKYHLAYRNVYYRHGGITAQIPAGLMDYEHIKWPLVPADNLMSTVQAMEHYRINCEVCDEDLYDESLST